LHKSSAGPENGRRKKERRHRRGGAGAASKRDLQQGESDSANQKGREGEVRGNEGGRGEVRREGVKSLQFSLDRFVEVVQK